MLKKISKLCAFALLPFCAMQAQNVTPTNFEVAWAQTYAGEKSDKAFGVAPATGGGLAILQSNALVITDKFGKTLSTSPLPFEPKDHKHILALKAGGFLLVGGTKNKETSDKDLIITRFDAKGKQLWKRAYAVKGYSRIAYGACQTTDNQFVVCGYKFDGDAEMGFGVKIDAGGKIIWDKSYDYIPKYEESFAQCVADDQGGVVFVGNTTSGFRNIWVLNADKDGNTVWQNQYGGDKHDEGYAIDAVKGGFLVVGSTYKPSQDPKFANNYDAKVLKIDPKGQKIWEKDFGGKGVDMLFSVATALDGSFLLAGSRSLSNDKTSDIWMLNIDADGKQLQENFFGGSNEDEVLSICLTTDGMFGAAGYTEYASDNQEDAEADPTYTNNVWAMKLKKPLIKPNKDQKADDLELDLDLDLDLDINWDDLDLDLEIDWELIDPTPKVWAVIVGVSEYSEDAQAMGLRNLNFPDDDAELMHRHLSSPKGGAIPKEQIRLLTNDKATIDNIGAAVTELFAKAEPQDLIVFYFAGHGGPGEFYAHDGGFTHEALQKVVISSKATKRLCIADACYSGSWNAHKTETKVRTDEEMKEVYYERLRSVSNGMALFMSSSKNQTSLELRELKQGLFTYYFVEGLKGAADEDGDKVISIQELYFYTKLLVAQKSYERGSAQVPQLQGFFDTEMPIGVTR